MTNQSSLIMTGIEWRHVSDLVSMVLAQDDTFREATKKTLLWNRAWVEAAQEELKKAGQRAEFWLVYVERGRGNHPIRIRTRQPERHQDLLCKDERLIMCVPENARVKATEEILLGIANACCKAIGLHNAMKEIRDGDLLTDYGYKLAKSFWKKCHLHWRRSVGARKAAWKRKGYIAEYSEVPDFREPEFHEGSKLLYDLAEEEKEAEHETGQN